MTDITGELSDELPSAGDLRTVLDKIKSLHQRVLSQARATDILKSLYQQTGLIGLYIANLMGVRNEGAQEALKVTQKGINVLAGVDEVDRWGGNLFVEAQVNRDAARSWIDLAQSIVDTLNRALGQSSWDVTDFVKLGAKNVGDAAGKTKEELSPVVLIALLALGLVAIIVIFK